MSSQLVVYVLLVTEVGTEHEILDSLKEMEDVSEARVVYGEFDVVCKMMPKNLRRLDEIVTKIRKTSSIIRTVTLISS
jgi:hypothetical protein